MYVEPQQVDSYPGDRMQKDTKTYRCDGCDKTRVFDFHDPADPVKVGFLEKELAEWVTIHLSAKREQRKGGVDVITNTVGHACSEECVRAAIAAIVKKKMPESK